MTPVRLAGTAGRPAGQTAHGGSSVWLPRAVRLAAGLGTVLALGMVGIPAWPQTASSPAGDTASRPPSVNDEAGSNSFGATGLVAMPSARFAPAGIVEFGFVAESPYRRIYLRLNPFDWLEVVYRRDEVTNVLPDGTVLPLSQGSFFRHLFSGMGHPSLADRSFDVKIRLWEEGRIRPAFAVGLQDVFGRAAFGGEYFAVSKRIGDLDFTAGLGFGYLGSRRHFGNPFALFSNRYKRRDPDPAAGSLNFDSYFRGRDVALFGGVEWFTPIKGLSLLAEYSGHDPAREPFGLGAQRNERLPLDFALRYRPIPWIDLGIGLIGGRYVTARASLRFDATKFQRLFESPARDPYPLASTPDRKATGAGSASSSSRSLSDAEETLRSYLQMHALDPILLSLDGLAATIVLRRDAPVDEQAWPALAQALFARLPVTVRRLAIRRQDEPIGSARIFLRTAANEQAAALLAREGVRTIRLHGEEAMLAGTGPEKAAALALALPGDLRRLRLADRTTETTIPLTADRRARWLARATLATLDRDGLQALGIGHDGTLALWHDGEEPTPAGATALPAVAPPLLTTALGVQQIVRLSADELASQSERARVQQLFATLKNLGVEAVGLSVAAQRWTLWVRHGPPARPARLLGRSLRAMAEAAPPSVSWFEVAARAAGGEAWRVEVLRRDVAQALTARGSPAEVATHAAWLPTRTAGPFGQPVPAPDYRAQADSGLRFGWGILPSWQAGIGHARDGLIRGDLYLDLVARLTLAGRLRLDGVIRRFIIGNLDKLAPPAARNLPSVRSDIAAYSRQGHNAIASLVASADWNWAPGLTSRLSAGLFEPMYGGVGIETTWHRPLSRWLAYGELFWVKKRGFGQGLAFQDYSTVTGSLGALYAFAGGLTIDLSLNRYLARDTGLRLEMTQRLGNGLEIGAWLAGSSRSGREFGRGGNLDKGIFIRMPLDGFWPFPAPRETVTTRLTNLLRDSGQRLQLNERLYERIFASDPGRIIEQLSDLFY